MSYQDHHPLYDDFQSTHYSSQQPTSQNTPPFQTRSLLQPYPLLDHVPEIQNVPHRNHMEPDGNLDGPWEVGASTQRQDVYTMPPHLNIPHFVPPPPHPEWPPFKNPPNPASPFHLYGQYRTQPTPLDAFAGDRNVPRLTFAGNLDPSTGIFYRTPEHPRLRTAQACEKCRTRKAKVGPQPSSLANLLTFQQCSGEHPSCKRCTNRGLVCEYAKEGRVRGPNKPKIRPVTSKEELARTSTDTTSRNSPSSDTTTNDLPFSSATYHSTNRSSHRRNSISTSISLGDHRPSRPRPPNLRLESSSNLYRLEGPRSNGSSFTHAPLAPVNYRKQRQHQQLTTTTPLQSPQTMAFNQSLTLSALTAPSSYLPMYGIEAPTANANATIDESSCGSSTPSVAEIYGDVQVGREEWERGGGSDCSQSMEGVASISWYVSFILSRFWR